VTQHHFKPSWRSTAHSQTSLRDLKVRSQSTLKWSKSDNYITLWKYNGVKSDIIRSPVLDLVITGGNVMRFVHKIEIRDDPVWIIPKSYHLNLISLITFVHDVRFGWCLYAQYMIRVWGIQKSWSRCHGLHFFFKMDFQTVPMATRPIPLDRASFKTI